MDMGTTPYSKAVSPAKKAWVTSEELSEMILYFMGNASCKKGLIKFRLFVMSIHESSYKYKMSRMLCEKI